MVDILEPNEDIKEEPVEEEDKLEDALAHASEREAPDIDTLMERFASDEGDESGESEGGEVPAADAAEEKEELVLDEDVARELEARSRRKNPEPVSQEERIRSLTEKFDSDVDYTTVLSNFEGPLDLLLFLITKNEIRVEDIFVSQVTEQFLAYLKGLPYLDVDKVTEYLVIAATILRIKAQSLVPMLDEMNEYYDDYDVEEDKNSLIRAIEEYRLLKKESEKLKERETVGYYFKGPDRDVASVKTVFSLESLTLDGLVRAFREIILRNEGREEEAEVREIPRDQFTVSQKILFVLDLFRDTKELRFEELFDHDSTRSEIVTTFQALLELLKHQYLLVRQPEPLGQIYITFNEESSHDWVGQQIDDYE